MKLGSNKLLLFLLGGVVLIYALFSLFKGTASLDTEFSMSGFNNENFYNCVVDAYNTQNSTSLDYTDELTDEQLATVTDVVCMEKNITSVQGIEKLTSIRNLDLNENDISEIDLSKNLNIQMLNLTSNNLTSIDVSNNLELQELNLNKNNLTSIDVTKNTKLLDLNINENDISEVDLSNNRLLQYVLLTGNNLSSLDLSNNVVLQHIYASGNGISDLKLPDTDTITKIDLHSNLIDSIDLAKYVNLNYLVLSANQLLELNLSSNTGLEELYLSNNSLSSLDLTGLDKLTKLDISFNQFNGALVIPNPSIIDTFSVEVNMISNYDFSHFINLKTLYVNDFCVVLVYGTTFNVSDFVNYKSDKISYTDFNLYNGFNLLTDDNKYISDVINGKIDQASQYMVVADNGVTVDGVDYMGDIIYRGYNQLRFVNISSDVYEINEDDGYIYVGTDDVIDTIKENIDVPEGFLMEIGSDYKLKISQGDNLVKEFDIVGFSSEKYELNKDNIYVGTSQISLDDIDVINCTKDINENKLQIKYGDIILKDIKLASINFGSLSEYDNKITLLHDLTYEDFINNITVSEGIVFKLFNDTIELISGNILDGTVLKVYYNEQEVDEFQIKLDNYSLELDASLEVDEDNNFIKYLNEGIKVSDLLSNVYVVGNNTKVVIYDNEDYEKEKSTDDVLASGNVLVVYMNDEIKDKYVLSVTGDSNGDGVVDLIDLVQIRKHIVGWLQTDTDALYEKTGVYYEAIDLNFDGTIDLIDLVRMRKMIVGLI